MRKGIAGMATKHPWEPHGCKLLQPTVEAEGADSTKNKRSPETARKKLPHESPTTALSGDAPTLILA